MRPGKPFLLGKEPRGRLVTSQTLIALTYPHIPGTDSTVEGVSEDELSNAVRQLESTLTHLRTHRPTRHTRPTDRTNEQPICC